MKKKCKVVALPTESVTSLAYSSENHNFFQPENEVLGKKDDYIHLYLTTDDEVAEGDYVLDERCNKVIKCSHARHSFKKIVSTTDKKLKLGFISEEFIKDYCDKGGYNEVILSMVNPVKENWTKEEVEQMCKKSFIDGWVESTKGGFHKDKEYYSNEWINNNL